MSQKLQKPDFICVGLPKAGTSTLHHVLDQHRDVSMPPVKELKYLINDQLNYHSPRLFSMMSQEWPAKQDAAFLYRCLKSPGTWLSSSYQRRSVLNYYFGLRANDEWYRSLFDENKVSGDITVNYFWLSAEECRDLAQRFPHAKIIFMLRSPVDLHWSFFRMIALKNGQRDALEMQQFSEHIENKKRIMGRYRDLVMRWRDAFSPDQVYVGFFDELKTDPTGFYTGICNYLGIAGPDDWSEDMRGALSKVVNNSPKMEVPGDLAQPIIDLSRTNLDGFEEISPDYHRKWQDDIQAFERSVLETS